MGRAREVRSYAGGCHCGALEWTYRTRLAPRGWSLHACQCSFCRGHGTATTSDPAGEVEFTYHQPDRLRRYRFGLRTADFLLCRECGVYLGAVMLTGAGGVATLNTRALRERPRGLPAVRSVHYVAESPEERRARRTRLWTPVRGPV
jgi:hypothetical protein